MPAAPADFRAQVESLRPYLLRYATLQLRNPEAAEDAVQEALVAALGERVALRVHLAICNGCRSVNAQFRFLRLAMKSLSRDGDEEKPA